MVFTIYDQHPVMNDNINVIQRYGKRNLTVAIKVLFYRS